MALRPPVSKAVMVTLLTSIIVVGPTVSEATIPPRTIDIPPPVYSALDSDQNLWALKDVNLRGASKELADSYLNEVDMLLTLRDTGRVIRLHDHEQTPTNLYLILELASVDLKDVFMELFEVTDSLPDDCPMAKLSPLAVAFYWDQMLRCVKVLHDKQGDRNISDAS
ncbi:hypothetical protein X801_07566 [Opisthorchis viverrini]|uniref:Protein kinase domain-containing protein n=1 Tax=Opisthorchis viverrini TaxID=6198 RepID=A0A1S8WQ92_OPIVI|nr:hypothetical protein X801_07566 [Opisthorchis viverrini]